MRLVAAYDIILLLLVHIGPKRLKGGCSAYKNHESTDEKIKGLHDSKHGKEDTAQRRS